MEGPLLDSKLKQLIKLCKVSQNYKKLGIIAFILISNTIDEISTRLAIRPRKKAEGEKLWTYMGFINHIFQEYIQATILPPEVIEQIKIIEILFFKLKGDLPYDHVKELYAIYFQLRKIKVPNLYESANINDLPSQTNFNLLFSLADTHKTKRPDTTKFKTMLMHYIQQEETKLKIALKANYDKDAFERALYLKKMKHNITSPTIGILSPGTHLTTHALYQISQFGSLKYIVWAGIVLFALLFGVILMEAVLYPYITGAVGIYLICFLSLALLLFLVHHKYISKRRD
jgi:hypothetical protein